MAVTDDTGRLTVNAGVPLIILQSYATYRAVQNSDETWPKLVALGTALLAILANTLFEDETQEEGLHLSKGELVGLACAAANAVVAMTQTDENNRSWSYISLGIGVLYLFAALGRKDIAA
jgi:hypothetical protein